MSSSNKSDWIVNDNVVESVRLIQPYAWYRRHDSMPFIICYLICIPLSLVKGSEVHEVTMLSLNVAINCVFVFIIVAQVYGLVVLSIVLIAHVALFLSAQVSPSIRCSLGNRIITDISKARSVLVYAQKNCGQDRVCELIHDNDVEESDCFSVAGVTFPETSTYFVFQNIKYEYDEEKNAFAQVKYPTASTLGEYCSHAGYKKNKDIETAAIKWGRNEYDIPMPEFVDLYLVS